MNRNPISNQYLQNLANFSIYFQITDALNQIREYIRKSFEHRVANPNNTTISKTSSNNDINFTPSAPTNSTFTLNYDIITYCLTLCVCDNMNIIDHDMVLNLTMFAWYQKSFIF